MKPIRRLSRWVMAAAMAYAVGVLPSCASMGGGMRYDLLPNLSAAAEAATF
ncbi:MAG TPA: hypothetical protein VGK37_13950 [Casimicrobiaceae bacterium]|jgi:hypothetical protein